VVLASLLGVRHWLRKAEAGMGKASKIDERVWATLISLALEAAEPAAVLAAAKATVGRVMPCTAHRDQAAFVALQALARAYGEGLRDRRKRLSDALSHLAEECASAIGRPSTREAAHEVASWTSGDLFES
jgi:hypothetical protein